MRKLFPDWSEHKNAAYLVREQIIGIIGYLELVQEGRNSEECLRKAVGTAKLAHENVEELFQMIAAADRV